MSERWKNDWKWERVKPRRVRESDVDDGRNGDDEKSDEKGADQQRDGELGGRVAAQAAGTRTPAAASAALAAVMNLHFGVRVRP